MKTEVEGLLIFLIFIMFFCAFTVRLTNRSQGADKSVAINAGTVENDPGEELKSSPMIAVPFKGLNAIDFNRQLFKQNISYGSFDEIQD